jgi:hypothetical protein
VWELHCDTRKDHIGLTTIHLRERKPVGGRKGVLLPILPGEIFRLKQGKLIVT